jgi:hypothetical protein
MIGSLTSRVRLPYLLAVALLAAILGIAVALS